MMRIGDGVAALGRLQVGDLERDVNSSLTSSDT